MTTAYIGLATSFHDPAIAVVGADGRIRFAEALERRLQTKRATGLGANEPNLLADILETHCADADELVVATTWRPGWRHAARVLNAARAAAQAVLPAGSDLHRRLDLIRYATTAQLAAMAHQGEALRYIARYWADAMDGNARRVRFRSFDHHLCHAAAVCFEAPEPNGTCAVIDGYGEWSSTAFFEWRNRRLRRLRGGANRMASLGWFYTLATISGGFNWLRGEEWKLMGLAGRGDAGRAADHDLAGLIAADGLRLSTAREFFTHPVWKDPGNRRSADFAAAAQAAYTGALVALLSNLHARAPAETLLLSGGCALNTSANGVICERTPFETLRVNSAPADDGTALGAALLARAAAHGPPEPGLNTGCPYLGSPIGADAVAKWARFSGAVRQTAEPHRLAAAMLAEGKVIGWVQGRAEFGPRALGNRSILADPRQPDIADRLNQRVKFRESFRPFAPAILDQYGPDYFQRYRTTRYMERTLPFRDEVKARVPGVVHADGTGRLQSVRRAWNPRYHDLIEDFRRRTGVPLVLNTSLNVMGKPIVHSLEDAVAVFATSGLDALFVGDRYAVKDGA